MKTLLCVVILGLLSLGTAVGQETAPVTPPKEVTKVIELKYLGTDQSDRLGRVTNLARTLMLGKSVQFVSDPVLEFFAIRGTPDAVSEAEQILRRFDVPAAAGSIQQISLTLYLLEAAPQPDPEHKIPAELSSVVAQIKSVFGDKSYQLVETIFTQSRNNSGFSVVSILPTISNASGHKTSYEASYKIASYSEQKKTITVNELRFFMKIPVGTAESVTNLIHTDVTLREGQKLVLGKVSQDRAERPLFLVVSAKAN